MAADPDSSAPGGSIGAIVILGGFMSVSAVYGKMRSALARRTGQPVYVVETHSMDWIPSLLPAGWLYVLRKLDRTVRRAAQIATSGRVTLIGHSAGGVLGRLYLSPEPFLGQVFGGLDWVGRLITLGSPHHNERRWLHGGMMARWVEARVPGARFTPQVQYCSVAGKLLRGDSQGSLRERQAYSFYEQIGGEGDAWGDGLVPVGSSLLAGSQQITLEGVGHFAGFGGSWYGTDDSIAAWWQACQPKGNSPGASPDGRG